MDSNKIMNMSHRELRSLTKKEGIATSGNKTVLQNRLLFHFGLVDDSTGLGTNAELISGSTSLPEPLPPPLPRNASQTISTPYNPFAAEAPRNTGANNPSGAGHQAIDLEELAASQALTKKRIVGGGFSQSNQIINQDSNTFRRNMYVLFIWAIIATISALVLIENKDMSTGIAFVSSLTLTSFIPILAAELDPSEGNLRSISIHQWSWVPAGVIIVLISIGFSDNEYHNSWGFLYSGFIAVLLWFPLLLLQLESLITEKTEWRRPRGTRWSTSWPITLYCILLISAHTFKIDADILFIATTGANLALIATFGSLVRATNRNTRVFAFLLGAAAIVLPIYLFTYYGGENYSTSDILVLAILPAIAIIFSLMIGDMSGVRKNYNLLFYSIVILGACALIGSMFRPYYLLNQLWPLNHSAINGLEDGTPFIIGAFVLALLSWPIIEISWTGMWKPPTIKIDEIVTEETEKNKSQRSDMTIGIVGTWKSGKSTYLASLWTLLRDNMTRRIWDGSAPFIENGKLPFPIDDIKRIVGPDAEVKNEKEIFEMFRKPRSYQYMFEELIDNGRMPKLSKRTNNETKENLSFGKPRISAANFPFKIDAENQNTRDVLDNFMEKVSGRYGDEPRGAWLDQTVSSIPEVNLRMSFPVNAHREFGHLLIPNPLSIFSKVRGMPFRIGIRTTDFPGEDFSETMKYLATKLDIIENAYSLDNLIRGFQREDNAELLAKIKEKGNDANTSLIDDVREKHVTESYHRLNVLDLIINSQTLVYLIDFDAATDINNKRHKKITQEAVDFLRIADSLAKLNGTRLESVICLLNKSDMLLDHDSSKSTKRTITEIPTKWDSFKDKDHAFHSLCEFTGISNYRGIDYFECYFTSTLGGIIPTGEKDGVDIGAPPHPMIPVNVIEPLIHLILTKSHKLR